MAKIVSDLAEDIQSSCSIHTNFTVVKANIDWPGVAETNEETVGAWVQYNGDDDDANGVVDAEESKGSVLQIANTLDKQSMGCERGGHGAGTAN